MYFLLVIVKKEITYCHDVVVHEQQYTLVQP